MLLCHLYVSIHACLGLLGSNPTGPVLQSSGSENVVNRVYTLSTSLEMKSRLIAVFLRKENPSDIAISLDSRLIELCHGKESHPHMLEAVEAAMLDHTNAGSAVKPKREI